jgi:hypothetical protein
MKTITDKNTESGLLSRPEPLSTAMQMQFDFTPRPKNRFLDKLTLPALTAFPMRLLTRLYLMYWLRSSVR